MVVRVPGNCDLHQSRTTSEETEAWWTDRRADRPAVANGPDTYRPPVGRSARRLAVPECETLEPYRSCHASKWHWRKSYKRACQCRLRRRGGAECRNTCHLWR